MKTQLPIFLLSLTCLSLLHLLQTSLASSSTNKEAQTLMSFKATLTNPSILFDWLPTNHPCSFHGVQCHVSTGSVSSMDLSSINLSTDFHRVAIFLLTLKSLESLSLRSTNLSGSISIPNGSKCSSVLSYLDLSQNGISGPVSDIANLGNCPALASLNLSSNSLGYFSAKERALPSMKLKLESLDLSFNLINGPNVVPFVLSGGCSELKFLSLKGNRVNGELEFSNCKSLVHLDVSSNNFSSGVPSFGDCLALTHLDISSNKFYGDLGSSIGSCKKLSYLNVSENSLSGPVPAFPVGSLKVLSLGGNHFQGGIPLHLVDACPVLTLLDLSSNNLSGPVPTGFASCTLLETFDISSNNFSGSLPVDTLLKMSSLRELDLSFNGYVGLFPDSLSQLTSLETLDLSANHLSGPLPARLCEDPSFNLKELYLQDNLFSGSIPAALANCSQLTSLHLSFNYLNGTIPPSLGSLPELRDLKLLFNQLEGRIPPELTNMRTLETLILDFNYLSGPIPSSISNLTNLNWVSLSNNKLSGEIPASIGLLPSLAILKLSNNSLSGRIPRELGDARSLVWLDLNSNLLNGTIPPELFKQSGSIDVNFISGKRYVYLRNEQSQSCHGTGNLLEFAGIRDEELDRIPTRLPCNFTRIYISHTQPTFKYNGSMIFLDLSHNALSGEIPKEIGTMLFLYILNLGHNNISGNIPLELGSLKGLNILDLSYNKLDGIIPQSMTGLSWLTDIDLSNNCLTGMIPEAGQFETFSARSFVNNTGLCGIPLPPCGSNAGPDGVPRHQKSHRRQVSLAGSVAMGLLFALFCIVALIIVLIETKKQKKKKDSALDIYIDSNSHSGGGNTGWKLSTKEALSISVVAFDKPLRKLNFADLLEATSGFHNDSLIGSGGFGDVYKAQLKDGIVVAIKKLKHVSGQGDREFTAEMETIGKIKHRNLVPLLGYCKVGEERLLVYEYMKFGSLEDFFHDRKNGIKLPWAARRKIALGAARGLAYLHHNCIPHIIHRDMKSSNVLIDENLEARVSDFGMARLMSAMDTHLSVSTLAGTPGYVPPEYYQSFRCSLKGDVYSYGVVLLELLTGKRPTDSSDFGDNNLVGWVKQHAKLKITDVFDPTLMEEDPSIENELLQHLKVACACLDDRHWKRPTMIQVMAKFKEIQASSGFDSQSTITSEDGGALGSVDMTEMSVQKVPEQQTSKQ